jgi:ribosomal protein S18 acetylase RimI-like enzyme
MVHLRPALATDIDVLWRMLGLAADWRPDAPPRAVDRIIKDPALARYLVGWPRPGDVGFMAEADDGQPLGAAWSRVFPAHQPGFGFVSADIPEVSIAVVPQARRTGIGRALMEHLIHQACARSVSHLSLSVEHDNPARELYGELGFTVAHDAVIIDGNPFSPSVPKGLRNLTPPPVGASIADIIAYQQQVAKRSQYALVAHGRRRPTGDADYRCPAAAGKLRCGLVSASLQLPLSVPTALTPPKTARKGSVCAQATKRFAASDIPLAQRDLFGSREWYQSWNRRNRVEGFFGNLKDEARESIRRGIVRVRTKEKVGFWLAFAVAAANVRLVAAFRRRPTAAPPKRKRGKPRKAGLDVYLPAGVATRPAAANAPPQRVA